MSRSRDVVLEHLNAAFELSIEEPPRRRSLRCSGLPYCPVLDSLVPDEPPTMNLEGALFTSMGTAAHSAIQLYMTLVPQGSGVWGSWECRACRHREPDCYRPEDHCNLPMAYVEAAFRVGPMTGHCDLIVRYGRRHVAYEFKTIGDRPERPKRMHVLQVRHYVAMMRLCHDLPIDEYVVAYVGRQYLNRWTFGPYVARNSERQTRDWIFRAIRGYKAATKARRDPSRANLLDVVRQRPCTSMATWDEYMARSEYQFGKGKCPLLSRCTAGDRECLKAMEQTVAGE